MIMNVILTPVNVGLFGVITGKVLYETWKDVKAKFVTVAPLQNDPERPEEQEQPPQVQQFNTASGNTQTIFSVAHVLFMAVSLILTILMFLFMINMNHYVEAFLFVHFIAMGLFGVVFPLSFYFKDRDLRMYVKRELLQM